MSALVVLAILAALVLAFTQLKSLLFKAKDVKLSKDAEKLQTEADVIKATIRGLKAQQANPGKLLSRDDIEEYWSKK